MDPTPQPQAVDSRHYWARPDTALDLSQLKPHACMTDIVQQGNYLHCRTGNHGMRIPAGKILNRTAAGQWVLEDMVIQETPEQQLPSKQ